MEATSSSLHRHAVVTVLSSFFVGLGREGDGMGCDAAGSER